MRSPRQILWSHSFFLVSTQNNGSFQKPTRGLTMKNPPLQHSGTMTLFILHNYHLSSASSVEYRLLWWEMDLAFLWLPSVSHRAWHRTGYRVAFVRCMNKPPLQDSVYEVLGSCLKESPQAQAASACYPLCLPACQFLLLRGNPCSLAWESEDPPMSLYSWGSHFSSLALALMRGLGMMVPKEHFIFNCP